MRTMYPHARHPWQTRLRVGILTLLATLIFTAPAAAYVVFLKDGSQITTAKKYEVKGSQVILTLPNGNQVSYKTSEIDFAKTDQANASGALGNVKLLETNEPAQTTPPASTPDSKQAFGDLISKRQLAAPEPSRRSSAANPSKLPMTSAGFVDLTAFTRVNYPDTEAAAQLMAYLKSQNLEDVRIYSGTNQRRALVEILVSSEASVFKAMKDAANCMIQIGQAQKLEALELLLIADDKAPAGQFTFNLDLANQLASGKIEPSTFFVRYVEF